MATMETIDYTDLGKEIKFQYGEKVYIIPTLSARKAKELMKLGKKYSIEFKKVQAEIERCEKENQEISEELDEKSNRVFDFQIEFIQRAMGGNEVISIDEIENWPPKMLAKLMEVINKTISITDDEEKKEN